MDTERPELNFERLKALRKEQGLSAEQIARKADVSVRHLRRLEAGQRPNTSAVTLARVALALGTTMEHLLGLADDPQDIKQVTERNE
jgi:transcriptional regulator with XRE-family HTH domain